MVAVAAISLLLLISSWNKNMMFKKSLYLLTALACASSTALAAVPTNNQEELDLIDVQMNSFEVSPPAHPRFVRGAQGASIVAAAKNGRDPAVKVIADRIARWPTSRISTDGLTALKSAMTMDLWNHEKDKMSLHFEAIAEAAFLHYLDPSKTALLADLSSRIQLFGPAIVARGCSDDIYFSREYMRQFALAYDFAGQNLASGDVGMIKDVMKACAAKIPGLLTTLQSYPDNALGFNALGKMSAALLLVRGDPAFAELSAVDHRRALKAYINRLPNWGGTDYLSDGGYSNGSSYFLFDTSESVAVWDTFARVLDYPIYEKPYVKNLPNFLLYNVPPNSPAGVFGDGAEVDRRAGGETLYLTYPIVTRYTGSANPGIATLSQWYLKKNNGAGDQGRLSYLFSPPESAASPASPTNVLSKNFSSVGVAAFHTSFNDVNRASLYFRSGPMGSSNHAHHDHNSFLLYNKGQVLAMTSGRYESTDESHWGDYYKKTMAHNAITYDDGKGQELVGGPGGTRSEKGEISYFNPNPDANGLSTSPRGVKYDIVKGNALNAYGAANLSRAERTMIFVRPSTIVIFDQLRSANANKTWEYNLHTPVTGTPVGENEYKFETVPGTSMCVKVMSRSPLTRSEKSGADSFGGFRPKTPVTHFWNKFAYASAALDGLFVSVIRLDCSPTPIANNVAFFSGITSVNVGNFDVSLTDAGVLQVK